MEIAIRQFKFRIWDSRHKNFLFFEGVFNSSFIWGHLAGETGQQYTGLKDVDRKEIYEGDIIEWREMETFRQAVNFLDGVFWATDIPLYEVAKNAKIIGNIFENPELLNETD